MLLGLVVLEPVSRVRAEVCGGVDDLPPHRTLEPANLFGIAEIGIDIAASHLLVSAAESATILGLELMTSSDGPHAVQPTFCGRVPRTRNTTQEYRNGHSSPRVIACIR